MCALRFEPFRDPFRELDRLANQMRSGRGVTQSMPMDVFRSGDAYHVVLDVPGVDPSSIDVTVDRGSLTIQAERTATYGNAEQVLVAERPHGQFVRELVIGEGVDAGRLQAEYSDGVLHLTLPVERSAQPRRVEVSRGQSGQRQVSTSGGSGQPASGAGGTPGGEDLPRH